MKTAFLAVGVAVLSVVVGVQPAVASSPGRYVCDAPRFSLTFEPEAFTNAVDARSEIVRVSRKAFSARKNCHRVRGTKGRWAPQRRETSRHRLVSCSAPGPIEFGLFERNGERRIVAYDRHTSTIFLTVVYAPGRTRLVWSAEYCYTLTED